MFFSLSLGHLLPHTKKFLSQFSCISRNDYKGPEVAFPPFLALFVLFVYQALWAVFLSRKMKLDTTWFSTQRVLRL